jgi:hypothetical protein
MSSSGAKPSSSTRIRSLRSSVSMTRPTELSASPRSRVSTSSAAVKQIRRQRRRARRGHDTSPRRSLDAALDAAVDAVGAQRPGGDRRQCQHNSGVERLPRLGGAGCVTVGGQVDRTSVARHRPNATARSNAATRRRGRGGRPGPAPRRSRCPAWSARQLRHRPGSPRFPHRIEDPIPMPPSTSSTTPVM